MNDIDIAVAEKVMGWTLYNHQSEDGFDASSKEHYEEAKTNDGWSWKGRKGHDEAWMFEPSTYCEIAIDEVVAKVINEFHDTCELAIAGLFPGSGDDPHWEARFNGFWNGDLDSSTGVGGSPAEAVCNAALEFVNRLEQRVIK